MSVLEFTEQILVGFRGARAGTAALTFGQRDAWNWSGGGLNPVAVVESGIELPDGVGLADIAVSLAVLMARHEALRTCIVPGPEIGDLPVQRVLATGELAVDFYQVNSYDSSDDDVKAQLNEILRAKGFDLAAGITLRVGVATRDGWPCVVVIIYSHVLLDFGSAALLGREFSQLVADSVAGSLSITETAPAAAELVVHQPIDQAAVEQSSSGQRRQAAAMRYWQTYLRAAPRSFFPVPEPVGVPGSAEANADCLAVMMESAVAGLALGKIAARTGVGPQAVLLTAVCTVLSLRGGIRDCVLAVMSGNRYRTRLHGYIGSVAQDSLVGFEVGGTSFDELGRRVNAATMAANTNSLYDIFALDQIKADIAHDSGVPFSRAFTFNNLSNYMADSVAEITESSSDEPANVAASAGVYARTAPLTTISRKPTRGFPDMMICYSLSLEPRLRLAFYTNTRYVAAEESEFLLKAVERLLLAAATEDLPLDQLEKRIGVHQFDRGPDWVFVNSSWIQLSATRRLVADATLASAVYVALHKSGDEQSRPLLVAYLSITDQVRTAYEAHLACLAMLGRRYTAMAPGYYILCDGVPAAPDDEASWQRLPVVTESSGRVADQSVS